MKKNILFIVYSLHKAGGVQSVLVNLMNELVEKYEITILTLDGAEEIAYKYNPKIKSVVLNIYGGTKSYRTMEIMDDYFSWLPKKANIKTYIFQYGIYRLLKKWLAENHQDYDTIVSTWYSLSSMLSLMPKKISKKSIAWEHISYESGGFLFYNILRPYYKNLGKVVYINNESEEYYKKLNPDSFLIRNVIGEPYEGTQHIDVKNKENIVLFVGRLHPDKNVKEMVNIFYQLKDPKDWKLQMVGIGEDKIYLENFIKENNITNIELLGGKDRKEVYSLMKKSKVLILTSQIEGLPTVLIEALFCSNILVSYDCKYGPANIINEKNGFLINMNYRESFKEKLQLLIDNKNLIEHLNKTAYEESEKWKKESILRQWQEVLG